MPSTFVNPIVNPDTTLGIATYDEAEPLRHWPTDSSSEAEIAIRAIYRQVLGNAYVMESERQAIPESQFKQGELSVVEFIRAIANSDLYRTRFFENGPRNRFIELNFKHFLGRAPEGRAEIAEHSAILDQSGYEAEIDAYLDSDEYHEAFGTDIVPFYRGYKTGAANKLVAFTHMFPLLRGASSSDKQVTANNPARLNNRLFSDQASTVVSPSGATSRQGSGAPIRTDSSWLNNLFSQPAATRPEGTEQPTSAPHSDSELALRSQAQIQQISQLQQQIAELRSLSTMGASILRKGQRPSATTDSLTATDDNRVATGQSQLSQQVDQQARQIEQLQGELMSARSLSSIAEYSLNKWRQRSY